MIQKLVAFIMLLGRRKPATPSHLLDTPERRAVILKLLETKPVQVESVYGEIAKGLTS